MQCYYVLVLHCNTRDMKIVSPLHNVFLLDFTLAKSVTISEKFNFLKMSHSVVMIARQLRWSWPMVALSSFFISPIRERMTVRRSSWKCGNHTGFLKLGEGGQKLFCSPYTQQIQQSDAFLLGKMHPNLKDKWTWGQQLFFEYHVLTSVTTPHFHKCQGEPLKKSQEFTRFQKSDNNRKPIRQENL